jgi:hypothetical protein
MEQEEKKCESKCCDGGCPSKKCFLWIFIIIVTVGGFFYYNQADAPIEDTTPIEVTENEDGTKTVRNLEEGFEVSVLKNTSIESRNNSILFYESEDKFLPDYSMIIIGEANGLSLEQWLEGYHQESWLMYYDDREMVKINDMSFYKIQEEGDPVIYSYYFVSDDVVYVLNTPEDKDYSAVLGTFKSLK